MKKVLQNFSVVCRNFDFIFPQELWRALFGVRKNQEGPTNLSIGSPWYYPPPLGGGGDFFLPHRHTPIWGKKKSQTPIFSYPIHDFFLPKADCFLPHLGFILPHVQTCWWCVVCDWQSVHLVETCYLYDFFHCSQESAWSLASKDQ